MAWSKEEQEQLDSLILKKKEHRGTVMEDLNSVVERFYTPNIFVAEISLGILEHREDLNRILKDFDGS